jgi:stage V sporulation protein AC
MISTSKGILTRNNQIDIQEEGIEVPSKKKATPAQKEYQAMAKKLEPKRKALPNTIKAFIIGGLVCTVAQGLQEMFIHFFHFEESQAGNPTNAVLIMTSALLTGLGVYDHIAQIAGAGTAVPITGFANSIASAAIEHRSEGYVLGVGGNMFKIAGPVLVFGTFAAFIIATIKLLLKGMGGV